jgi:hypothetical protein
MRANEFTQIKLQEFNAATQASPLNLSKEQISQIPKIGVSDSLAIYGAKINGQSLIAHIVNDVILAAVIFDDNVNLRGIRNDSNIKGLVSVIMIYIFKHLSRSLTISKSEPLTMDGLLWVCSNLKRNLFTILNIDGTTPNEAELVAAWHKSREDFSSNDIELIISQKAKLDEAFFKDEFKLMHIHRIAYGELL